MAYAFGHPNVVPSGKTRCVPVIAQETALLVVDVQYYASIPERGCHANVKREDRPYFFDRVDKVMVPNIVKLLESVRATGVEVIYTVIEALTMDGRDASLDYKLSGPLFVPRGHPDAAVLAEIAPKGDEILIPKTSCSVFCSTNINYVLRNLGTRYLLVCGQVTNQCVESAVRDAADLGYLVTVPEDCCAANSAEEHERGLQNMKGFARIVRTEELISELASQGRTVTPGRALTGSDHVKRICLLRTASDKIYGAQLAQMAREMLAAGGGIDFEILDFDVQQNKYPSGPSNFSGYLVMGSLSSVARGAKQEPWIPILECFVQTLVAQKRPLVGICFGHQVIASSLGGVVVANPAGPQTSHRRYSVTDSARDILALPKATDSVALFYHHSDAVVTVPANSESWGYGASGHWGMTVGTSCLSTQAHPEFSTPTGRRVLKEIFEMEKKTGKPLDTSVEGTTVKMEEVQKSLEAMELPTDYKLLASAFAKFLCPSCSDGSDANGGEPRMKKPRVAAS